MDIVETGHGRLFASPDPDEARAHFASKSRSLTDKRTTIKEAVQKYVKNGAYFGSGGFGANRISTAVLHEIVRQGIKDLAMLGHTATHDFQILAAGNCINRCDASYIVGLEARGLSSNARRLIQSGEVEVTEWSNFALAARLQAAADGLPFAIIRSMMGTDTLKRSAAKVIECPFTGKKMTALPALWPDVSVIHVHEADIYGNARIMGISASDLELARASKTLIITTERLVPNLEIRNDPTSTSIPYYIVDAVIESPYGCYPGNMPYEYFSDEEHLNQWLTVEKDPNEFKAFLDKYIYNVSDHSEYLELCGGLKKLTELRELENLVGE